MPSPAPISPLEPPDPGGALRADVVRYYTEATADYRAWSRELHMHFGYYRGGANPFAREAMLREMTWQVLARLGLDLAAPQRLIDLGCGLAGSARIAARRYPRLDLLGLTLVPWQVTEARRLVAAAGVGDRVRIEEADFTATGLPAAGFDGAWAIESACHDTGDAKAGFIREAARLLRPGARLVVADGFLIGAGGAGSMSPPLRAIYRRICRHWALESFARLDAFVAALRGNGFEEVVVDDISFRIAPSVGHIPWVTAKFLAGELVRERLRMSGVRWGHVLACVLAPLLGMARHRFRYCIVSARRAGPDAAR